MSMGSSMANSALSRIGKFLGLQGWVLVAFLGVLAFHVSTYPPIALSVAVFGAVGLHLAKRYRAHKAGFLVLWFFIVYALPFIHVIPYLWFDFDGEAPQLMWGLAVNAYMVDESIIQLMALIGALGAVGFVIGQTLGGANSHPRAWADSRGATPAAGRGLTLPVFCALIGLGVLLSWLYAPRQTIFDARYTEGVAISQDWNFGSIWMVSYILVVWCLADALLDADRRRAGVKNALVLLALLLVIGWLQLLRGDREAIPLAVAGIFMMVKWRSRVRQRAAVRERVWTRTPVLVGGGFIVVLSYVVGALRSSLAGVDWKGAAEVLAGMWAEGVLEVGNLIHGTCWVSWSLGPWIGWTWTFSNSGWTCGPATRRAPSSPAPNAAPCMGFATTWTGSGATWIAASSKRSSTAGCPGSNVAPTR